MRRLIALVLACAMATSAAMASPLHVHEYVGHDHPDHHHGPATHEHEHSPVADRAHHADADDHEPAIAAEWCDPGRHVVSVRIGCARVWRVSVDLAELPGATRGAPSAPVRPAIPITDVRVHGPPFDVRTPSRAPPLTYLA